MSVPTQMFTTSRARGVCPRERMCNSRAYSRSDKGLSERLKVFHEDLQAIQPYGTDLEAAAGMLRLALRRAPSASRRRSPTFSLLSEPYGAGAGVPVGTPWTGGTVSDGTRAGSEGVGASVAAHSRGRPRSIWPGSARPELRSTGRSAGIHLDKLPLFHRNRIFGVDRDWIGHAHERITCRREAVERTPTGGFRLSAASRVR